MSLFISFVAGAWLHRDGFFGESRTWAKDFSDDIIRQFTVRDATLPLIKMDMNFKNFQTIAAKRTEALDQGILFASDADFVSADLKLDSLAVPIRARLKGDWVDHLRGNKWSYRIEVKGDQHLLGMSRFSIQHPATRKYVLEWGFFKNLRMEGILSPRYDFIELVFNGENKGFFALEEHFARSYWSHRVDERE